MKKFSFTLEVLLKVKCSLEKQHKALLMEAQRRLLALEEELLGLYARRETTQQEYRQEGVSGVHPDRLRVYGFYFEHLRQAIAEQKERIEAAQQEKLRLQAQLLRTMKEIKALRKLREKQYQEYLAQVAREEEKAIGDLVSFKVASGQA